MFYNAWIVWITLLIGFLLQMISFPEVIWMFRPHWLLLILLYWILALPGRFYLFPAFFMGLLYDLFTGTFLGVHCFIFTFISYIVALRSQAIRNYALWQQMIVIFFLSLIYDLFLYLFQAILLNMVNLSPFIFLSSLSDAVIWILITFCLKGVQKIGAIE